MVTVMAESVFAQLPLWGRLVVSFVIFFGIFGSILFVILFGMRTNTPSERSTSDDQMDS